MMSINCGMKNYNVEYFYFHFICLFVLYAVTLAGGHDWVLRKNIGSQRKLWILSCKSCVVWGT